MTLTHRGASPCFVLLCSSLCVPSLFVLCCVLQTSSDIDLELKELMWMTLTQLALHEPRVLAQLVQVRGTKKGRKENKQTRGTNRKGYAKREAQECKGGRAVPEKRR